MIKRDKKGHFVKGSYAGFGFKEKHKPWNKGKKGIHLSPATEWQKGVDPWNKGTTGMQGPNSHSIKKGQHLSAETEFKKGNVPSPKVIEKARQRKGDKHPNWRADQTGYGNKHSWLKRNYGKANRCKNKGCVYPRTNSNGKVLLKPKRFDWANISQKYKRELSDWTQLCGSCHKKYDMGLIKLEL